MIMTVHLVSRHRSIGYLKQSSGLFFFRALRFAISGNDVFVPGGDFHAMLYRDYLCEKAHIEQSFRLVVFSAIVDVTLSAVFIAYETRNRRATLQEQENFT